MTCTLGKVTCPPVTLSGIIILQAQSIKYLGMHLERRPTWRTHIWNKRKQLGHRLQKMYWLLGHRSKLSLENKLLLYKSVLKPIWTYGIQLWGSAANFNIEILERFQSKVLRTVVNAPWFVTNEIIRKDLQILTVKAEIANFGGKYIKRLNGHPNPLAVNLLDEED